MSLLEIVADEATRERQRERDAYVLARQAKQDGLLVSDHAIVEVIWKLSEDYPELGSEIPLAITAVLAK